MNKVTGLDLESLKLSSNRIAFLVFPCALTCFIRSSWLVLEGSQAGDARLPWPKSDRLQVRYLHPGSLSCPPGLDGVRKGWAVCGTCPGSDLSDSFRDEAFGPGVGPRVHVANPGVPAGSPPCGQLAPASVRSACAEPLPWPGALLRALQAEAGQRPWGLDTGFFISVFKLRN